MRLHIELSDETVREVDRTAGIRGRTRFVRDAIERALADQRRLESLQSALGAIADTGHEWDEDPAEWVRRQRFADPGRVG